MRKKCWNVEPGKSECYLLGWTWVESTQPLAFIILAILTANLSFICDAACNTRQFKLYLRCCLQHKAFTSSSRKSYNMFTSITVSLVHHEMFYNVLYLIQFSRSHCWQNTKTAFNDFIHKNRILIRFSLVLSQSTISRHDHEHASLM